MCYEATFQMELEMLRCVLLWCLCLLHCHRHRAPGGAVLVLRPPLVRSVACAVCVLAFEFRLETTLLTTTVHAETTPAGRVYRDTAVARTRPTRYSLSTLLTGTQLHTFNSCVQLQLTNSTYYQPLLQLYTRRNFL